MCPGLPLLVFLSPVLNLLFGTESDGTPAVVHPFLKTHSHVQNSLPARWNMKLLTSFFLNASRAAVLSIYVIIYIRCLGGFGLHRSLP